MRIICNVFQNPRKKYRRVKTYFCLCVDLGIRSRNGAHRFTEEWGDPAENLGHRYSQQDYQVEVGVGCHISRRTNNLWSKRVLQWTPRLGKRNVGNPRARWTHVCERRLVRTEYEKPRIEPSGVRLEKPISNSELR